MELALDDSFVSQTITLTLEEVQSINRIIHNTYIAYDDIKAMEIATRLYKELDSRGISVLGDKE